MNQHAKAFILFCTCLVAASCAWNGNRAATSNIALAPSLERGLDILEGAVGV